VGPADAGSVWLESIAANGYATVTLSTNDYETDVVYSAVRNSQKECKAAMNGLSIFGPSFSDRELDLALVASTRF
jgi:hypothetical protein